MNHVVYGHLGKTYPVMTRGEGVYVLDEAGNRYLDEIGADGYAPDAASAAELAATFVRPS